MAKRKVEAIKLSDEVKQFLDLCFRVRQEYSSEYDEVHRLDRATQDYLHELELGSPDNRKRTATALARCRRARRASLDQVEIREPLITLLDKPEAKAFLKQLGEVLGKVRKEEEKHVFRAYIPKEVSSDELTLRTIGGSK